MCNTLHVRLQSILKCIRSKPRVRSATENTLKQSNSPLNYFPQVDDFQQQISDLEQNLMQKTHEVEIMQNELKQVKEFRRKRAQMQKELEEVYPSNMYLTICLKKLFLSIA